MSIAHTMSLLGSCNLYCSNATSFAQKLSAIFSVNIEIGFNNQTSDFDGIDKENELIDNGYKETYFLYVTTYDYERGFPAKESEFNEYQLIIPVDLPADKDFYLVFHPNHIVQLQYPSFNGTWRFLLKISVEKTTTITAHEKNCLIDSWL